MNRLDWKRRIGNWVGGFTANERRTVILLYHSVGNGPLAVSESVFREQIAWLAGRASIVPLAVALAGRPASGTQVVITFDDGYASLHDCAASILAEHGATATVFLNTGWICEAARKASDATLGHYPGNYFMTWREVAALAKAGWTIGSHGVEHVDLPRQGADRVVRELCDSKLAIETRLAQPCEHFAYPWGRFTANLQQQVQEAGYRSAVSGVHGPVLASADRLALPRIDIRAEYEPGDFADVVLGRWDFLGLKQQIARAFT